METVVVFDLDDTLYKEIDFLKSAYREIADYLSVYGVADAFDRMMAWYEAKLDVFGLINQTYGLTIPKQELLAVYRNHSPGIRLDDTTLTFLQSLVAQGCRVGLITDGRSVTQRNKIKALGLGRFVEDDDIVISEEFGSEKPDERNYNYFANKYPRSRLYYIADNPKKDFITPNRMGWTTIGLLNDGRNIHAQPEGLDEAYYPQMWVASWKEIRIE